MTIADRLQHWTYERLTRLSEADHLAPAVIARRAQLAEELRKALQVLQESLGHRYPEDNCPHCGERLSPSVWRSLGLCTRPMSAPTEPE